MELPELPFDVQRNRNAGYPPRVPGVNINEVLADGINPLAGLRKEMAKAGFVPLSQVVTRPVVSPKQ